VRARLNISNNEISNLYKQGKTLVEIGLFFDCSYQTINNRLKEVEIARRPVGFQKGHLCFPLKKYFPPSMGFKGKYHTEKSRKKMSDAVKKAYQEGRCNPSHPCAWKGKHLPLETRKKMSKIAKKMGRRPTGKGEKHWNWKGGISPILRRLRRTIKFKEWREAVFARDNWICQKCGVRSGNGKIIYLHPHHIKSFAKYPELRFIIDNGITFCKECHQEFHKIYGRKDNTGEQTKKFLGK